jgi:glycosyltransferase involved in cell wall biosynthesis
MVKQSLMQVAVYYPPRLPESFRVYADNVIPGLERMGVKVLSFQTFGELPESADLIWDIRAGGGLPPAAALLQSTKPLAVTVYGVAPMATPLRDYFQGWKQALRGKVNNFTKVRAWSRFRNRNLVVITISEHAKTTIARYLKLAPDRIHVCYLGVDRTIFHPSTVASHGEHILHISNDEPRKNVDRIVAAYQSLQPTIGQPLLLKLPVDRFRQEAGDIRVITNRLSDEGIARLYRKAAVLVFPSLYEGFGLPILEAMASGCPVITSNSGACAEVAGKNALLVEPKSVKAIAEALERILTQPELRRTLIDQGMAHASQFTWERCAAQHQTLFQNLLANRN